jgi:hypothetical protein
MGVGAAANAGSPGMDMAGGVVPRGAKSGAEGGAASGIDGDAGRASGVDDGATCVSGLPQLPQNVSVASTTGAPHAAQNRDAILVSFRGQGSRSPGNLSGRRDETSIAQLR